VVAVQQNPFSLASAPRFGTRMQRERRGSVEWSREQVAKGLPDFLSTTDPVWLAAPSSTDSEGWSVRCRFETSPRMQGNPSVVFLAYVSPEAPRDVWHTGTRLYLFERGTQRFAIVTLLE
jgi:hypothetical protein